MAEERGPVARLIDYFADLPGIGRKSAERLAYHVLGMSRAEAIAFADAIRAVKDNLRPCKTCFNLAEGDECVICRDPKRDRGLLCVVEQVRDLLALEDYPADGPRQKIFYGQSAALVRWLIARRDAATFIRFLDDAAEVGMEAALDRHYAITSLVSVSSAWKEVAPINTLGLSQRRR